jgi:gamma-glutamyltranspeptidase/glutathione hydrolase
MVVSGHVIASRVGRGVLKQGGNAVDAAVAVGFALAVVHPEAGNLGGGGFLIVRLANGTTQALDFREVAPLAASHDMFLDPSGRPGPGSLVGARSAGVPGTVAGLIEAHRRFGRLPLARLIAPAIWLAEKGFVIDEYRHHGITRDSARLALFPAVAAAFLPGGRPLAVGERLRQPELARTLRAIRDRGADGFYTGWVADSLVAEMERDGGLIRREDLDRYRPVWREPLRLRYRDYAVVTMPPPSSGGVVLGEILNLMGGYSPLPPFGSAPLLHLETEAMRRAFTDRNRYLGDPDRVRMPLARLLSAAYADSQRATIDTARATPTPPFDPALRDGNSTTHFAVIDRQGNAVSATTTLNNSFGSLVLVRGAGFLLNNSMDDFAVAPGLPNEYGLVQGESNAIAPGKRVLSTMTPTIVLDPAGHLFLLLGAAGGPRIITAVYQVLSLVVDRHWTLRQAVSAPRIHHQALPDEILVERDGFSSGAMARLRQMGHTIRGHDLLGDVEAIIRTHAGWLGASDPRRGGGGAGY